MKALQWVNDKDLALHIVHFRKSGMAEVGYTEVGEASESLLTIMDNDRAVATIVLAAALNHVLNNPRDKKRFLEGLKLGNV